MQPTNTIVLGQVILRAIPPPCSQETKGQRLASLIQASLGITNGHRLPKRTLVMPEVAIAWRAEETTYSMADGAVVHTAGMLRRPTILTEWTPFV